MQRHATLRTKVKFERGGIQLIEDDNFSKDDFVIKRNSEQWELEPSSSIQLTKRPQKFDLKKDLLVNAEISSIKTGGEVLQLTAHHFAADDNSMGRVSQDVMDAYIALLDGKTVSYPPLASETFKQFAMEQHKRIETGHYKQKAEQLCERLTHFYTRFGQRPIIEVMTQEGVTVPTFEANGSRFGNDFSEYVAALSWGFKQVFQRTEFVFCAHVALRRDSNEMPRVGMFINLLPIFISVDTQAGAEIHVASVKKQIDEAMSRSDIPYEYVLSFSDEFKKMGRFPFDAFVNELRFENDYGDEFRDVVVPRSFATDFNEISMSVMKIAAGDKVKLESPCFFSSDTKLQEVYVNMMTFLSEVSS